MLKRAQKLLLVSLVLLAFVLCSKVYAEDQLKISSEIGFAGKCKLGGFNPVEVVLEAADQEIKGTLRVSVGEKVFSHSVELAPGAIKRYEMSVPIFQAKEQITIEFIQAEKVIETEVLQPEILSPDSIFLGIISDKPENYTYIKGLSSAILPFEQVELVQLTLDKGYGLQVIDNFNLLVLDDYCTDNISPVVQETLKKWIARGNSFLVGAGKYKYKTLTGMFAQLNSTTPYGEGVIVPVEDLENCSAAELQRVWETHLTSLGINKIIHNDRLQQQINQALELSGVADSQLQPRYHTVLFLLSVLFIYIVLLLGATIAKQRLPGAFVLVIVCFSLLSYGLALKGGVASSKAAGACINHYQDKIVKCCGLKRIYPYQEKDLSVKLPDSGVIAGLGSDAYQIDPLENTFLAGEEREQSIFTSSIHFHDKKPSQLRINANNVLEGSIFNPLPEKMHNCVMLVGDTLVPVGDLAGMEQVQLNYQLDYSLGGQGDFQYLNSIAQQGSLSEDQRQLLEYYYYNLAGYSACGKLLGFTEEPTKLVMEGKEQKIKQYILNAFDLEWEGSEDQLYLPRGVVKPLVDSSLRREVLGEEDKDYFVYYALPTNIMPQEIKLYVEGQEEALSLEAFNYVQQNWMSLRGEVLTDTELEACTLAGPLTLKIRGGARIFLPQIAVKGSLLP